MWRCSALPFSTPSFYVNIARLYKFQQKCTNHNVTKLYKVLSQDVSIPNLAKCSLVVTIFIYKYDILHFYSQSASQIFVDIT